MARPRKISEGVERRILELLERGLCVSHVAREVGLSDVTIKRQRERDSGFNKWFLLASKRGEDNIRNQELPLSPPRAVFAVPYSNKK